MCDFCVASISSVNECVSKLEQKAGVAKRLGQVQILNKYSAHIVALKSMKKKHNELEARLHQEKINCQSNSVASIINDLRIVGIDLASSVLRANCIL
jgi:hypothetical protein